MLEPSMVCGKEHVLSAVMHAEKAFADGTNRAKNILTEIVLYAACERQISKALKKMKPREGSDGMVAVVLGIEGDLDLDTLGAERDDSLMDASLEKAEALGVTMFEGVSVEDAVLEQVATVDLLKA